MRVALGVGVADIRQLAFGRELVGNGDVESGIVWPDDWFYSLTNTVWTTEDSRSGSRSLKIHTANDTADWRSLHFPAKGNARYRLQGHFKGQGGLDLYLTIRWWSNPDGTGFIDQQSILLDGTYAVFTRKMLDSVSPPAAQSGDIVFWATAPTTVEILGDDFSVREMRQ